VSVAVSFYFLELNLPSRYRLLENHSNALKSEMQEEANLASERLRKCKEEHAHQLESVSNEFAAKMESLNEEHRKSVEEMRRKHRLPISLSLLSLHFEQLFCAANKLPLWNQGLANQQQ
jgi:hypothetical protein